MALAQYSDLKTAVATFLSRSDLTSNIPDFITLAHYKLMRTLRTREMETVDTALSIGAETVNVPTLWLETRSMYLTSTSPRTPLQYIGPEQLIEMNVQATLDTPLYFSVIAGTFQFAPLPDQTYTATHVYYKASAAMSLDADTNWILTSHPDLYLYGSLLQAETQLKEDDRIALWQQMYDRGFAEVTRNSNLARSGTAMITRPG